ncbi:ankyrin repeat domain-containing protein [Wolbachia endosymbiont of Ctenocephalides felis wCfeT]|uniref:ankyrin repeat domain-containing protein n=1 Tax=Wolbachia endosymbiont of Ctenocephalides felis wCfeT TaxID=2732593 RepID=UPI001444B293|nr:ankyrin repeat domain-containing protein [Wolbachia endosymbiont of Ctenocephalides felis wCfeT]
MPGSTILIIAFVAGPLLFLFTSTLYYVANKPSTETQKLLNPEYINEQLRRAAARGNTDKVQELMREVDNLDAANSKGWTALHLASKNGHYKIVATLLTRNNVNIQGKDGITPLHLAAISGHKNVVELLLSKGAEVDAKDNCGKTPLHNAAARSKINIMYLLMDAGADPSTKDKHERIPLYYAKRYAAAVGGIIGFPTGVLTGGIAYVPSASLPIAFLVSFLAFAITSLICYAIIKPSTEMQALLNPEPVVNEQEVPSQ